MVYNVTYGHILWILGAGFHCFGCLATGDGCRSGPYHLRGTNRHVCRWFLVSCCFCWANPVEKVSGDIRSQTHNAGFIAKQAGCLRFFGVACASLGRLSFSHGIKRHLCMSSFLVRCFYCLFSVGKRSCQMVWNATNTDFQWIMPLFRS